MYLTTMKMVSYWNCDPVSDMESIVQLSLMSVDHSSPGVDAIIE